MTCRTTPSATAIATNRGQCRIAAARKKRFWRNCNIAFLAIHTVALLTVGFIAGDGWFFRAIAASIVIGPLLVYLEHSRNSASCYDSSEVHQPSTQEKEVDGND